MEGPLVFSIDTLRGMYPLIPLFGIFATIISRNYVGVVIMVIELLLALSNINFTIVLIISLFLYVAAGFSSVAHIKDEEDLQGPHAFSLSIAILGAISSFALLVF